MFARSVLRTARSSSRALTTVASKHASNGAAVGALAAAAAAATLASNQVAESEADPVVLKKLDNIEGLLKQLMESGEEDTILKQIEVSPTSRKSNSLLVL